MFYHQTFTMLSVFGHTRCAKLFFQPTKQCIYFALQIKLIKVPQNDLLHYCTSVIKHNILRRSAKTVENLTLPFVQLKKDAKDSRDSRFLSRIQSRCFKTISKKSHCCSRQCPLRQWGTDNVYLLDLDNARR